MNDIIMRHEQILYPTVRVTTSRGGGSGTILYSCKGKDDVCTTMILTNHHVIEDCIEVKENWDQRLGKSIKKEFKQTVKVEFFKYNGYSHCIGSSGVDGDIVAYDALQDIALIKLRDKENTVPYVATIMPKDAHDNILIFDEVWCCGAALGHDPLPTKGYIGGLDDEYDNYKYGLSTAASIYGNSGGGLFRYSNVRDRYEYIGMPSMAEVSFDGFSSNIVTHMGYYVPIDRITAFLDDNNYQFIYDLEYDEIDCNMKRNIAKKESRKELEREEGVVEDYE